MMITATAKRRRRCKEEEEEEEEEDVITKSPIRLFFKDDTKRPMVELDLHGVLWITDDHLLLLNDVKVAPFLRLINLSSTSISKLDWVPSRKRLKTLIVNFTTVKHDEARHLEHHPKLEHIEWFNTRETSVETWESFSKIPRLVHLKASWDDSKMSRHRVIWFSQQLTTIHLQCEMSLIPSWKHLWGIIQNGFRENVSIRRQGGKYITKEEVFWHKNFCEKTIVRF